MNLTKAKRLKVLDGAIIFLISVTLLLLSNIVFAFFVPADALQNSTYYFLVGVAELIAVGVPPVIYILAKKIAFKDIFKKKISKEQTILTVFIALFAYPVLAFIRILWVVLLDALNVPMLSQSMPAIPNVVIFIVAVVSVSVIPAFSEEIIFRGIIQETYGKKKKIIKAILFSSLFFMVMHGDLYSYSYTFAAGVILGALYYLTNSLWTPIIYHAVNNFVGIAINYLYSMLGYEELFEVEYQGIQLGAETFIAIAALLVVAIVCAGVCVLLIWGLLKVTRKTETKKVEELNAKIKAINLVPYFVGGGIMVLIALFPTILAIITG